MNNPRITLVLPNARIIPRIELDQDLADELSNLALRAHARANGKTVEDYAGAEPLVVMFAPVRALDAANHFVSDKEYETALPAFRRMVSSTGKASLKRAVTTLLKQLPPDGDPPFPQMRRLVDESGWQTELNPTIVRKALKRWVELMDELSRMTMTGGGPPPIAAQTKFVGALARYWKRELSAKIENTRDVDSFKQRGFFANFVRKAAKIIPEDYRPANWDVAIRQVIEKKR